MHCSDLERIGNSLSKLDNQHTLLGKSGLLWSDPIQDKTPLYDQLMQTYSWTQKVCLENNVMYFIRKANGCDRGLV